MSRVCGKCRDVYLEHEGSSVENGKHSEQWRCFRCQADAFESAPYDDDAVVETLVNLLERIARTYVEGERVRHDSLLPPLYRATQLLRLAADLDMLREAFEFVSSVRVLMLGEQTADQAEAFLRDRSGGGS